MTETRHTDWGDLSESSIASIKRATSEGVVDGIRAAIEDEELIKALVDRVFVSAREELATTSGKLLWAGIGGLFSRLGWALVIAGGILALGGGWAGVLAFFKGATIK